MSISSHFFLFFKAFLFIVNLSITIDPFFFIMKDVLFFYSSGLSSALN